MKKILVLAALMACINVFVHAQTTQSDYNYLTGGFKNDIFNGSGLKPGYYLEKIGYRANIKVNEFITRSAFLFVLKVRGQFKGYMVKIWDTESYREYYCIPAPDSENDVLRASSDAISIADPVTRQLIEKVLTYKNFK